MSNLFNHDYFESGPSSGLSLYTNYRWLPHLTIPMAKSIYASLHLTSNSRVLDFGCAKGYLVKALRYLDVQAFGYDISEYAISEADTDVVDFLYNDLSKLNKHPKFHWIISKDVFEHISKPEIKSILKTMHSLTENIFLVVPLSRTTGMPYIVPEYELDVTHIIREPVEWWVNEVTESGYNITSLSFSMSGVKDDWFAKHPTGNLFLQASSKVV